MADPVTHTVTAGVGRTGAQGRSVPVPGGVEGLARWLNTRKPEGTDTWWSVHAFRDGYRAVQPTKENGWKGGWESAAGVGVDMDYCHVPTTDPRHLNDKGRSVHTHELLPPELASRLDELAREGKLPGNLFHLTRRGFRLVFVFDAPCTDLRAFQVAAKGATERVAAALAGLGLSGCPGLQVDTGASEGMGKVLWAPKGPVQGEATPRDFSVLVMRPEPYALADLRPAPPAPARPSPVRASGGGEADLDAAVERYNRDHPRDLPRNSGTCPVCGYAGGFGELPGSPGRWSCWNTDHEGAGIPPKEAGKPWTGDSLDLDAHEAREERVAFLRRKGYLAERPQRTRPAPRNVQAEEWTPEDEPGDTEPQEEAPPEARVDARPFAEPRSYTLADLEADRTRELVSLGELPHGHGWGEHLDALTGGGLMPGDVVAVGAAKAGAGKTAFVMQLADGLALRSMRLVENTDAGGPLTPMVLLSEMDRSTLARRTLARLMDVSPRLLRSGKAALRLGVEVEKAYADARELAAPGGLLERLAAWQHVARPTSRVDILRGLTRYMHELRRDTERKYPGREVWPVAVVDPIQRWQDPSATEVEALNQLAENLDELADRHGWVVFLTSDTNKASKEVKDADPAQLFRGSYKLQHSCDYVLALMPDEDPTPGVPRNVDALVVKNRNGPEGARARFEWEAYAGLRFVGLPDGGRRTTAAEGVGKPGAKRGKGTP